jgi:hypothetical protein
LMCTACFNPELGPVQLLLKNQTGFFLLADSIFPIATQTSAIAFNGPMLRSLDLLQLRFKCSVHFCCLVNAVCTLALVLEVLTAQEIVCISRVQCYGN